MNSHGALARHGVLDRSRRVMVGDFCDRAVVYRPGADGDTIVADCLTRAAGVDASQSGRDVQAVVGNSADRVFVIFFPAFSDVKKEDEVWLPGSDSRFRVVAIDKYGGALQVICKAIQ